MPETDVTIHVADSLIEEHRSTEKLLLQLETLIQTLMEPTGLATLLEPLQVLLAKIHAEMNTHFACEEQALFPAASRYHPMVLMEVEHEELIALRDQLEGLTSQLKAGDGLAKTGFCEVGTRFIQELRDHIGREEAGIFPICERCLSNDEKQAVIDKMNAIRAESHQSPTPTISRPPRYFKVFETSPQPGSDKAVSVQQLEQDAPCKIKQLVIQAGESLAEHWSPNPIILYCIQGEADFEANRQHQLLQPGMGIYIAPQLTHALHAKSLSQFLLIQLLESSEASLSR